MLQSPNSNIDAKLKETSKICLSYSPNCNIQTMLNVLKQDTVKEFSVRPSSSPMDHFTPAQAVQVTSVGFERLDKSTKCNVHTIEVGPMRLRAIGSGASRNNHQRWQGPHTLVVAVEMVSP